MMCTARERAELYGPAALTTNELLEVIFGSKNEKDYGDIRNMTIPELIAGGCTREEAVKAVSLMEYCFRITKEKVLDKPINTPEKISKYCSDMRNFDKEHFRVLFLNTRCRIVNSQDLTVGTESASLVSVREVLTSTLRHGVSRIILAHNHPSGDCLPSEEDIQLTKAICAGCNAIQVQLLDHMIISSSGWYSFKEKGIL